MPFWAYNPITIFFWERRCSARWNISWVVPLSTAYWKRVQMSWTLLFRNIFEIMKRSSKIEEKRQKRLQQTNRKEALYEPPQTTKPQYTVSTSTSDNSFADFSSSSYDSLDDATPPFTSQNRRETKSSSESMRNLLSPRNMMDESHGPAFSCKLRRSRSPVMSLRKQLNSKTKSISMRNIPADQSSCGEPALVRKIAMESFSNHRARSLRNLFSSNEETSSTLSPPPPTSCYPSPSRSVEPFTAGRPGFERSHSSRRDCAVFARSSPGTPGSQQRIYSSQIHQSPSIKELSRHHPQSPRKEMSKKGVKLLTAKESVALMLKTGPKLLPN